jgi:hypothetical protein
MYFYSLLMYLNICQRRVKKKSYEKGKKNKEEEKNKCEDVGGR